MPGTTFEEFRRVSGWQRPGGNHGCLPVEVLPGVWTARYHEIDSLSKLTEATQSAPIKCVVNSATCQCEARTGFYGPDIDVYEVDVLDDNKERKMFDAGKPSQSRCAEAGLAEEDRCAGNIGQFFDPVCDVIDETLAKGGHVLIHCHASLSRSVALILAYAMRSRRLSLAEAAKLLKSKWDATWPNDRFVFELIAYEKELNSKAKAKKDVLRAAAISAVVGFFVGVAAAKKSK